MTDNKEATIEAMAEAIGHYRLGASWNVYDFVGEARAAYEASGVERLEGQIKQLADWIVANVPGEPSQSQGAVDTAIRIMERYRKALKELDRRWERPQRAYLHTQGLSEPEVDKAIDALKALNGEARP